MIKVQSEEVLLYCFNYNVGKILQTNIWIAIAKYGIDWLK